MTGFLKGLLRECLEIEVGQKQIGYDTIFLILVLFDFHCSKFLCTYTLQKFCITPTCRPNHKQEVTKAQCSDHWQPGQYTKIDQ